MINDTPEGKRTIRVTVRGSIVGYVGKINWLTFGERNDPAAEARAAEWLAETN